MRVASRDIGWLRQGWGKMNRFFQVLVEGRPNRKADFKLHSAEGNWGYPKDMLIAVQDRPTSPIGERGEATETGRENKGG
jgi:hypothetical protein